MKDLTSILESILFVASKPLTVTSIARALEVTEGEVENALTHIGEKYTGVSGIHYIRVEDTIQLVTNPENAEAVEKFVARDILGELTRAQLETLTVIGYRGPITRPEIEEIRGVNCAVILRTLLIRDLIDEHESKTSVLPTYTISLTALRHLGVDQVSQLPDYEDIHHHAYFNQPEENNSPVVSTESAAE